MLKTLLAQIKEYKKDTILTPVLVVVEVILEVVIPLLMAMIIDKGIEVRDMNMVVKLGIITLLASFISLAAGGLAGKYAAKASTGFAKNLRKAMYYNIQDFSFANIDKYSTAGLVTRMMTDVTNEATSSIDTRTESIVQSGMDKLMEGRTVFVIAHRLSTIKNSDAIMVLDQGRIIERGDHDKLIKEKGTYYQLYTGGLELD